MTETKFEQTLREVREAFAKLRGYSPPKRVLVREGCRSYYELESVVEANEEFRRTEVMRLRAELDAARAESARLLRGITDAREAVATYRREFPDQLVDKVLEKLVSCPACTSPKVVATCERCGHQWAVR